MKTRRERQLLASTALNLKWGPSFSGANHISIRICNNTTTFNPKNSPRKPDLNALHLKSFGVNVSCLVADLGHVPPFTHILGVAPPVLDHILGRKTKYSSKHQLLLNLFHVLRVSTLD